MLFGVKSIGYWLIEIYRHSVDLFDGGNNVGNALATGRIACV